MCKFHDPVRGISYSQCPPKITARENRIFSSYESGLQAIRVDFAEGRRLGYLVGKVPLHKGAFVVFCESGYATAVCFG